MSDNRTPTKRWQYDDMMAEILNWLRKTYIHASTDSERYRATAEHFRAFRTPGDQRSAARCQAESWREHDKASAYRDAWISVAAVRELEEMPGKYDRMKARIDELERTNRQLDESVSHIVRDITLSTIDEGDVDDVIPRITNLCESLPCSLSGEILSTIAEFDADAPSMCAAIGQLLAPAARLQRMEPR